MREQTSGPGIHQWGRWEGYFESVAAVDYPVHVVDLRVELVAPSGDRHHMTAFWDGDRAWRARYSPGEVGTWTYITRWAPPVDGLDGQQGTLAVAPYEGDNPLYRHCAVGVAPS